MVHRDLKPQNLMLTPAGKVKILDFGLAKIASEQRAISGLTRDNVMMGTPHYLAPEQALDAAKADIRADIYSLGCTLYYLLAGRPPFDGDTEVQVLLAHQNETPRPLSEICPDVPRALSVLVDRMLAKDPAARPQTPKEVAQELLPFAKGDTPAHPRRAPAEVTATRGFSLSGGNIWLFSAVAAALFVVALLVAMAAGLFSVRTPEGTIVIANVPPAADVLVDGNSITVAREGDAVTISAVAAGDHHLKLVRNGEEIWSSDVAVPIGGEQVRVSYEPLPPSIDSDRPQPSTVANHSENAPTSDGRSPAEPRNRQQEAPASSRGPSAVAGQTVPPPKLRLEQGEETSTASRPLPWNDITAQDRALPKLEEVALQWNDADMETQRRIERERDTLLAGLPTFDMSALAQQMGNPVAQPGFAPQPPPGFNPQEQPDGPASAGQRLILSAALGSIREVDHTTWVMVWPGPAANMGPPNFGLAGLVAVEFAGAKLAETLADYNANERVRIVAERGNWVAGDPRAVPPAPVQGGPGRNELRMFRMQSGAPVVYWCLKGVAIEKEHQPQTWVTADAVRRTVVANRDQLAHSVPVVFRRLPSNYGRQFMISGQYVSAAENAGTTTCTLVMSTCAEGPIVVQIDLGGKRSLLDFTRFTPGETVQAPLTIRGGRVRGGPRPDNNQPTLTALVHQMAGDMMNSPMRSFPMQGAPPVASVVADPMTIWTGIEGTAPTLLVDHSQAPCRAAAVNGNMAAATDVTPDMVFANSSGYLKKHVTWKGRLSEVVQESDETLLTVKVEASAVGLREFEVFARDPQVLSGLRDYWAAGDKSYGALGDEIEVSGTVAASDATAIRRRTTSRASSRTPLLELESIQRVGEPDSLVRVGKARPDDTFQPDRALEPALLLFRQQLAPGKEVQFAGRFRSFDDSAQIVNVQAGLNSSRTIKVHFEHRTDNDFSDYKRDDVVDVKAVGMTPQRGSTLELEGRSIVRRVNPLSIVTNEGLRHASDRLRRTEQSLGCPVAG